MLLFFLFYVLGRRSLWTNIYNAGVSVEIENTDALVLPIEAIISKSLTTETEPNFNRSFKIWTRWVRFPVQICIVAAFEILTCVWKKSYGVEIRGRFLLLCWKILNAPLVELLPRPAAQWLVKGWNEVQQIVHE